MEPNKSLAQGMQDSVKPAAAPAEGEGTYLPRILDMKVVYGLGDGGAGGERKPDPHKVLFYHDTVGDRFYDCGKQEWCHDKPSVVEHLPSRPLLHNDQDVIAAIAHGVMDDADFEALDKSGMMGEMPKKLWGHIKHLKKLHEDLEREQHALSKAEDESQPQPADKDLHPEGHAGGDDEPSSVAGPEGEGRMAGDDVISEIVRLAMADSDDRIRQIVREELAKMLGEGSEQEPIEGEEPAEGRSEGEEEEPSEEDDETSEPEEQEKED